MLLQIIYDNPLSNDDARITVSFQDHESSKNFDVELFDSPFATTFKKIFTWYFNDYVHGAHRIDSDEGVVEKYLTNGRYLGDNLIGEDHELISIAEVIEEGGYENLEVVIRSSDVYFFDEFWESLILHNSKYVLSTVVKGFKREYVGDGITGTFPEKRYGLHVTHNDQDFLATTFSDSNPQDTPENKPLRILYVIGSLPKGPKSESSFAFNFIFDSRYLDPNIEVELITLADRNSLVTRLSCKDRPIHIVHFDGDFLFDKDNMTSFRGLDFEGNECCLPLEVIANASAENDVGLWSIDARGYYSLGEDSNSYTSEKLSSKSERCLAQIAQKAHSAGLGTVLGFNQVVSAPVSACCFRAVYAQLLKGFNINQAVVEARKQLQTNPEISLTSVKPTPLHTWNNLVLYSLQDITFFEQTGASNELNRDADRTGISERLFGFKFGFLPPLKNQFHGNDILEIIQNIEQIQARNGLMAIGVAGDQGMGKSQVAHLLALYLVEKKNWDYAFYFDFDEERYTVDNMLEMIASALEKTPKGEESASDLLKGNRCCFVLDNIMGPSSIHPNAEDEELNRQILLWLEEKHCVITTGIEKNFGKTPIAVVHVLRGLCLFEQNLLVAETQLRILADNSEMISSREPVLEVLNGNPWLTEKVSPLMKVGETDALRNGLVSIVDDNKETLSDAFFSWRAASWDKGNVVLLRLCSEVTGLLLEILMIAVDQQEPSPSAGGLFKSLGLENNTFSELLEIWEINGFVKRLPHGRFVNERAQKFILSQPADLEAERLSEVKVLFSAALCDGLRIVSRNLPNQPNASITNNVLVNRHEWARHLEVLWFEERYRDFLETRLALESMLRQAKLEGELWEWGLRLLAKAEPGAVLLTEGSIESQLAWLTLATSALNCAAGCDEAMIHSGAGTWRDWLFLEKNQTNTDNLVLQIKAAEFLQIYYFKNEQFKDCISVTESLCMSLQKNALYDHLIRSYKLLSKCYSSVKDLSNAKKFETRLINEIPYEEGPPGLKLTQMLEIVYFRMARDDFAGSKDLIDEMRKEEGVDAILETVDLLYLDILFRESNYDDALDCYIRLWQKFSESDRKDLIDELRRRAKEFEKMIGREKFRKRLMQASSDNIRQPWENAAGDLSVS